MDESFDIYLYIYIYIYVCPRYFADKSLISSTWNKLSKFSWGEIYENASICWYFTDFLVIFAEILADGQHVGQNQKMLQFYFLQQRDSKPSQNIPPTTWLILGQT